MDKSLAKAIKLSSKQFFNDMLQLDAQGDSPNALQQDLSRVCERQSKFPWRVMVLSMEEVKLVIKFFDEHAREICKGAAVSLDKVQFYHEQEGILNEKPFTKQLLITEDDKYEGLGGVGLVTKYYMFLKPPQPQKIKTVPTEQALALSAQDVQTRKFIRNLLMDAHLMD